MAKRRPFSRWRRLPKVYRFGEHKLPDANLEPQRLTVYLAADFLDAAEGQAVRAGIDTVQEYCAELLCRAIEAERIREHVAEVESKRGPLEGLHEIANDPEYLAEWSAQAGPRVRPAPPPLAADAETVSPADPVAIESSEMEVDVRPRDASEPSEFRAIVQNPASPRPLSEAAVLVLVHAGQREDDPLAFLPSLRRGESVSVAKIAELAGALRTLEEEFLDAGVLDRRVAFALHRLAFEGQILHTDAWPGAFDEWTVDTLRAVQEAVERILSGQDIRYYSSDGRPEDLH